MVPHRLMGLNACPTGSGTVRRCGFLGVGVVGFLLFVFVLFVVFSFVFEEGCH